MKVKDFTVESCSINQIRSFVELWHYSHNVNGITLSQCFALLNGTELIGAMIYGKLGMANAWKKYAPHENEVLELRRLCCIDDTPKNTESYFIGKTLKYLRKHSSAKVVISYADTHYGHEGTIYKAANFKHLGMTNKSRVIVYQNRQYHDKTIRTYYTDKYGIKRLKPFAQRIKDALETGEAVYQTRPPKHIYGYCLD